MEVALITGKGSVEIRDFPEPVAPDGGVVVDISFCGVCGTDVHAYQSGRPYNAATCGHEWVGAVSEVGAGVTALAEGDRVSVCVAVACGRCAACAAGQSEHCQYVFAVATGRDPQAPKHGGFARRIGVSTDRVIKIHPTLADDVAAQIEPTTVAFHAVRRSGIRLGDLAVVQGAGPIGLVTAQLVRAAGARDVLIIEPNAARQELARQLGFATVVAPGDEATQAIRAQTNGLGADVVYECVGRAPAIQVAVDHVRRGGIVSLIGLADTDASIVPGVWLVKEVKVQAALAYTREDFSMAMSLMADGRVQVAPLHSKTVSVHELAATLEDLGSGSSSQTKVLVDPNL